MKKDNKKTSEKGAAKQSKKQYSLNDDRRVKVLSPGAMVAKRFFRNRIAMIGLFVLIGMFVFSFLGGLISPYKEDQLFYRNEMQKKEYAAAIDNTEFRYASADGQNFSSVIQAKFVLAQSGKKDSFEYKGINYTITEEGNNLYSIAEEGTMIGIAYKDIFSVSDASHELPFTLQFKALKSYVTGAESFEDNGKTYKMEYIKGEDGSVEGASVMVDGKEFGYISRYVVSPWMPDNFLTREFKETAIAAMENNESTMEYTDAEGNVHEYFLSYNASTKKWTISEETVTRVYDKYASPSAEHWLGTDKSGMDMLTRLMYGGRVSLMIGFIVEIISTLIGIILGGVAGYFGGWIDNLIMRIVDIFYCIPSLPIIIILGATMDAVGVEPQIRMIYLMLILGLLGWPGLARLIRGQILSLREQEFMTATEACGISVRRRIFRHLIPNVIPQLIVSCTMGLGGTIITEATLSFLGLGVKFPFASWGNIINDVNNTFVLTNYWFIWIPAGMLLLLTVLAFNILGDGLRDAFDPKMKR